jgi:hypothetical protein
MPGEPPAPGPGAPGPPLPAPSSPPGTAPDPAPIPRPGPAPDPPGSRRQRFDTALTTHHKSLTVTVGLDDNTEAYPVTVACKAGQDGEKTLKTATAQINRPVQVTVDLTGVAILPVEAVQADGESAGVALGDAMLHQS